MNEDKANNKYKKKILLANGNVYRTALSVARCPQERFITIV